MSEKLYLFSCSGHYCYDLGGDLYDEDECLVTEKVKNILEKILMILSENQNFSFDIEKENGMCNNWDYHDIDGMWSFSDVEDDEIKGLKRTLSTDSFEYDIDDTVCMVAYEFIDKFTDDEIELMRTVFDFKPPRKKIKNVKSLSISKCPFCGGESEVVKLEHFIIHPAPYVVSCKNVTCRGFVGQTGTIGLNGINYCDPESAIKDWNRRA